MYEVPLIEYFVQLMCINKVIQPDPTYLDVMMAEVPE
jgi:hypothetical protein